MSETFIFENPFKPDPSEYKREINPVGQSIEQYALYLHKQTGAPLEQTTAFVKSSLKKGGVFELKDRPMTYSLRQDNGDRIKVEGGVLEYIGDSLRNKDIISPSFTCYLSPDIEPSILSEFAEINIALRAAAKKAAFAAKANGDAFTAQIKKLEQDNRKISNNSLSGAHCSNSTPLVNRTAHSTLTSICRITSGYGNANNERILSGNRHYYSYDVVINNITSIISASDYTLLQSIVQKYDLYIPTAQDCLNVVVSSAYVYFTEEYKYRKIFDYLCNLNDLERAAFVYTGDFYHFREFNDKIARDIIGGLSKKISSQMPEPMAFMKSCPGEVINLAHQICGDEMGGIGHEYSKINGTQAMHNVACTAMNIMQTVMKYGDIFKFVFVSKNVPPSIGHFPESMRKVVPTSDTDSTIFTVQEWIHWFFGNYYVTPESISVQATMTFLVAYAIVHTLATISINMGIVKRHMYLIEMKSEFRFDVFVPTQIGKTYYASIGCQEGNVRRENEMEIKGVQLKSSNIPKPINKLGERLMEEITIIMRGSQRISGQYFLQKVAMMEASIEDSIRRGETIYLRSGSIKDASSYSLPPNQSPYQNHVFWNTVFGPKYIVMPEPPYQTMKTSLDLPNNTSLKKWFENIEDTDLKNRLIQYFKSTGKSSFESFNIPLEVLENKGFPIEVLPVVNYRKIAKELCRNLYLVLETLGFFFRPTELVRDVYPNLLEIPPIEFTA